MTSASALTVYVIYSNPADYPGQYVVRAQHVSSEGVVVAEHPEYVGTHLGRARMSVPPGSICLGRQPEDDPAILEAWV